MTACVRCQGSGLYQDRYLGEADCQRCQGLGVLECRENCPHCGGSAEVVGFILGGECEESPCPNARATTKAKAGAWHDRYIAAHWRDTIRADRAS